MSFYSPHCFVCTNKRPDDHPRGSCGAKNAESLRQYLREKMKQAGIETARANSAGCLDQCENDPVMVVYPEGIWYRLPDTNAIDRIVTEHFKGGKIVQEFVLTEPVKKA